MDVLAMDPGDAALWIAERFHVPTIPRRHRKDAAHDSGIVGYEQGLELLIRSGLFATMSEAARCIAPVLLAKSTKERPTEQESLVRISYAAITRFSGVASPNAISKALTELVEIGFLGGVLPQGSVSPLQPVGTYVVTPNSNELFELANAHAAQMKTEIAAEKEIRAKLRRQKTKSWSRTNQLSASRHAAVLSTNLSIRRIAEIKKPLFDE